MARTMSLLDLIRSAETLKNSSQTEAVEPLYASWIQHNQDDPLFYAALFNYSVVLTDLGKLEAARSALERAIALNPDFMPAYINLGRIYERQGTVGLSVVQWSVVLKKLEQINGNAITHKITALNQIARTLETANQDDTAEDMLRQSLEIDPRQREVAQHLLALRQRQSKWPIVDPWDRVERSALMTGLSPLSAAALTDDPMLHLAIAAHYNRLDIGDPEGARLEWDAAEPTDGPVRIGYLSSDLRQHAVGHLFAEVPGLHDRSKVEVFLYYCGPHSDDEMHSAFKSAGDHWCALGDLDDESAARRIAEDRIQILIDVNGYTREARHKLVALRPAPVIVNWLGFPGTMASPYHQYIIADDWIIPPDQEIYYSEKVMRLPCYQPTNRQRTVSERVPSRAEAGLPDAATVFCCFNGTHKITRFTFDRWMLILAQVPDSVLWLLSSTEPAHERLKAHAALRGIDPNRLIFADKRANPDHLARYRLADLFLDTTPYGAHTTASDALWMGVPVLTVSGRSFASRVCGSLVRAAGLADLVCETVTDYVERAVALGRDRALLVPYRQRLEAGRDTCTLFDVPLLVNRLEQLYAEMWADHRNGTQPVPDLANLDVYLEVGTQIDHDEIEVQTIEDYQEWWRSLLLRRHRRRPIPPDRRLFPAAIAAPDRPL